MPAIQRVEDPRLGASLRRFRGDRALVGARSGADQSPPRWRRSEISGTRALVWGLCGLLLLSRPLAAGDKVDVIHLRNGDRLTCEIKKLDRSMLTISTDPLGGATVHWGEIVRLESPRTFDITLGSGEHYYGSMLPAAPGEMIVALRFGVG